MNKYFVSYYINRQKVAGIDNNSGGYPYPTDFPGAFKIWTTESALDDYIKTCNYGKTIKDKDWLTKRVFNYTLSL